MAKASVVYENETGGIACFCAIYVIELDFLGNKYYNKVDRKSAFSKRSSDYSLYPKEKERWFLK